MTKQEIKEILQQKEVIIDAHTHIGISPKFYYQFGYPYALSLEDMVVRMEMFGIDRSVVFPFVDSAFYDDASESAKIKTTNRHCQFPYELENRNLLNEIYEIFPEHSQKVLPFFMFDPSRNTEEQAAHMEELSEKYAVFGLKTATTYIQAFVHDLETKGKPILDFAKKRDLPIIFHSSVHPDDPWAAASDIVDFAERNPDIRICIAHSARFTKPVLEKADRLKNCFVDLSAFLIHCKLVNEDSASIAAEEIRFEADYSNPLSVMTKLAEAFPDTILWGTDTPFYYWIQKYYSADGTLHDDRLDCGYKEEHQLFNALPPEIKTRIAYKNTIRFIFGEEK
ncbi:MAG: amidohydrolase family protein [Bacteroidota bacterium]